VVSRPMVFSVDLTGLGLQVLVGIGFCVRRRRIFREIQASDFACREMGKDALGRGFLVFDID